VLTPKSPDMAWLLLELSKKKELWLPDEQVNECLQCKERFSTVKRRHHCRMCGRIYCKKCSRGVIELPTAKLRCCVACILVLESAPEQEILQFVHARLGEAACRGNNKPNSASDSMAVSSDSDGETESDLSSTPSSSVESSPGFHPPEQMDEMMTETPVASFLAPPEKKSPLNGQLYLSKVEVRNLDLKPDYIAIYALLALGKQQVRTVDTKLAGLSHSAEWSEGFYFDVTDAENPFEISIWAQYSSMECEVIGEAEFPISSFRDRRVNAEIQKSLLKNDTLLRTIVSIRCQYTTIKQKVSPDDFQLLQVVGRGNFGKVMQVRKKDTGRIYAMKVLRKEAVVQNDAVEHTISEKNVLKRISHPFIVSLKYSFQTADKLYLVLDYLCGGELFTHLSSVDHFTEDRTRFYAAQIVLALGHLHQNGIIYRDLKPENLMLDMDGYLCLTDFGLCKEGLREGQKTNTFCGSPEYLAPEILKYQPYDKAVDWWALGTFIFEMLSGWPPFFDEDHKKMNRMILSEPLAFDPTLFSPHAQSLISGLLERDPAKRLGSGVCGTQNIKNHPFFASVNWTKLYKRQIEPPYKPHLRTITDTCFFSEEFTGEPVKDSYVDSYLSKTCQNQFEGFSWQNASEFLEHHAKNLPEYAAKRRTRRCPSSSLPLDFLLTSAVPGSRSSRPQVDKDSLSRSNSLERETPSPRHISPLASVNDNDLELYWESPPVSTGGSPQTNGCP